MKISAQLRKNVFRHGSTSAKSCILEYQKEMKFTLGNVEEDVQKVDVNLENSFNLCSLKIEDDLKCRELLDTLTDKAVKRCLNKT